MAESAERDYEPGPSWWAVLLLDWRRSNADVMIYLRGGATLGPGKVSRIGTRQMGESWQLHDPAQVTVDGRREVKWDFDAREVIAVRAVAPR